jgi:hypothetical protein
MLKFTERNILGVKWVKVQFIYRTVMIHKLSIKWGYGFIYASFGILEFLIFVWYVKHCVPKCRYLLLLSNIL